MAQNKIDSNFFPIGEVEKLAKEVLVTQGYHKPQMLIMKDKKLAIVLLNFDSRETMNETFKEIRSMFVNMKPDFYYYIHEGWMKVFKLEKGEKPNMNIPPSQCPDRIEVLSILRFDKDGNQEFVHIEFTHDGDKIVLGKRIHGNKPDTMNARMNFYLEDAFDEKMKRYAND